jgi:hypothetical protein
LDNVRVFGLNRLDSLELKKQFPDAQINFEPGATKDPQHGELATAAVIALTVAGIHALAAWRPSIWKLKRAPRKPTS